MFGMNREECTTQAYATITLTIGLAWVPHISLLFERTLFLQAEGECMVCAVNNVIGYKTLIFKDVTQTQWELNNKIGFKKYNGKRKTGWHSNVVMAALYKKGWHSRGTKSMKIKRYTEWDYLMSEDRIKEGGKYVMLVKSRTVREDGQPAFFHSFSIDYSEPFPLMFDGLVPYAMALTKANMMYMCFNLKQNIVEVFKIFRL